MKLVHWPLMGALLLLHLVQRRSMDLGGAVAYGVDYSRILEFSRQPCKHSWLWVNGSWVKWVG